MTRYILWGTVTVLLIVILWNPWGRKADDTGLWTPEFGNMKADLVLEGVRYRRNIDGRTRWIVMAERARMFESAQKMLFDSPDICFIKDDGNKVLVAAESGDYSISREVIRLYGNVVARTDDNASLASEFLRFSQKQMLLSTATDVIISKGDGLSIDGNGMFYDINRGRLVMYNVTAVVPDDNDTLNN
jgi:LPS export ABC transporter protein LptC